ncbi:MAG: cytochrome c [Bacteroidota bacterium]
MKLRILSLAFVGAIIYSCSPKVAPAVTEAKPPVVATLSAELAEGKSLYENNCAKCHRLYDRHEFTPEQWTPITISMQQKAKIQDVERQKIYNYLTMK